MADGLLSSGLGMIDRTKQALAARFGLLASNPEEFARQLAAETQQRMGKGLIGEPKTAEEMASGQWINTPYGKQAIQAFSVAAPIAYHGSPYIFDKFDINKVGTGEGAQAYGHGIYFAERPGIAAEYQKNLSSTYANRVLRNQIKDPEYRKAQADILRFDRELQKKYKFEGISPSLEVMQYGESKFPKEVVEKAKSLSTRESDLYEKMQKGALYKVDIPDAAAKTFLDWDKPLSQQSKEAQNVAKKISDKYGFGYDNTYTGGDFYRALTVDLNASGMAKNFRDPQAAVSEMLKSEGMQGIKYFDAASRGAKEGTRNYVVFDPSTVKILERNNQPVQGLLK